jgi:hypothetical protein
MNTWDQASSVGGNRKLTGKISIVWQILYGFLQDFSPDGSDFTPQMALAVGRKLSYIYYYLFNTILV